VILATDGVKPAKTLPAVTGPDAPAAAAEDSRDNASTLDITRLDGLKMTMTMMIIKTTKKNNNNNSDYADYKASKEDITKVDGVIGEPGSTADAATRSPAVKEDIDQLAVSSDPGDTRPDTDVLVISAGLCRLLCWCTIALRSSLEQTTPTARLEASSAKLELHAASSSMLCGTSNAGNRS